MLESTLLMLSESSTLDLTQSAVYNAANVLDCAENLYIETIKSINKLIYELNSQGLVQYKSKILDEVLNNQNISLKIQVPKENQSAKLIKCYKEAMENSIDLKDQISVTKDALREAPIKKGEYLMEEIAKYRKRFGPVN
jgi:hypothetical protein